MNPQILFLAFCMFCAVAAQAREELVVASADRLAAAELAGYLGRLYPQVRFVTADRLPASGKAILVGSDAAARTLITDADLSRPESFAVRVVQRDGRDIGVIAGADPRGAFYGVYALLERLGCGFCLSGDALPPPRSGPFSFDGWALASAPLTGDRLVFNWHNFLSGCSTWNLADWNRWTGQSQKMGYNAIMVHAYGNNPMVSFTFNGRTKPVGWLSTTAKGRDWSTMHVSDVRRLFGGQVFGSAVFGAEAAQVPETERVMAARDLMRNVFAHARERAMEVCFATDVDTGSANPQELILTLPESARFATRIRAGGLSGVTGQGDVRFWLANPETPEGHRYYKAQVAALMKAYPQITTLVVWFRQGGTPWMNVKVEEMPPRWQEEWRAEIARTPDAAKLWHAPQVFAVGKIVRAFERALKELGCDRVHLAAGTWNFQFLAPCDRFFPPQVKLIGLDYGILHNRSQLADAPSRKLIGDVASHRPVVPVIWAQHDDGNYIGRSYTPFTDFSSRLADAKAAGFGIIHWTTRPLDLFFKSHAEQVWSASRDRPLRATCDEMAARFFGVSARATMGEYFERWITGAPMFARETSDFFIDRPLTNVAKVVAGCLERRAILGRVDPAPLTPDQRDRLDYFKGLEEFIASFHQAHELFQRSQELAESGDEAAARAALADCHPARVIEQFARFSSMGGITRGEQGLVVSLNTRWLSHVIRLRQQLGLEPVRCNFGPTSHDPLAQSAGKFTFHFDRQHRLWLTLGELETGATPFTAPKAEEEICRGGIECDHPLRLAIQPIMAHDSRNKVKPALLPAGEYSLRLLMLDPSSTAPGQRVFTVSVGNKPAGRVDIYAATGAANRMLERSFPVKLGRPGSVEVTLTPIRGKALVCAAVLEPAPENPRTEP